MVRAPIVINRDIEVNQVQSQQTENPVRLKSSIKCEQSSTNGEANDQPHTSESNSKFPAKQKTRSTGVRNKV